MTTTKNSPEAAVVKELLQRKESGQGPHPLRPMEHLAFAILMDSGVEVGAALAAIGCLRRDFVDWNEVRVARVQEMVRIVGPDLPGIEQAMRSVKEEYNAFFDKRGVLSFDFLADGKPSETRRSLNQLLPRLAKGGVALLLFEFCPGASLPLSDEGLKQARKDAVLGKTGDRNQLTRLLADCLSLGEMALLLQYWELEALGHPYGEQPKKATASAAQKKAKKALAKARNAKN